MNRLRRRWRLTRQLRRFRAEGVYVAPGSFIHPDTRIGRGTRINTPSHLDRCEIGAFCAIGGRLVVRSQNHFTSYLNMQEWAQRHVIGSEVTVTGDRTGDVVIGNGVWIGDSVIVLPGVTIGDGAVVGAGSVVTRSIAPYAVAAGNPARTLRARFSEEVIAILAGVDWWHWSDERLKANRRLFELDLTTVEPAQLARVVEDLA